MKILDRGKLIKWLHFSTSNKTIAVNLSKIFGRSDCALGKPKVLFSLSLSSAVEGNTIWLGHGWMLHWSLPLIIFAFKLKSVRLLVFCCPSYGTKIFYVCLINEGFEQVWRTEDWQGCIKYFTLYRCYISRGVKQNSI